MFGSVNCGATKRTELVLGIVLVVDGGREGLAPALGGRIWDFGCELSAERELGDRTAGVKCGLAACSLTFESLVGR